MAGGLLFGVGSVITGITSVKAKTVAMVAGKTLVSFNTPMVVGAIAAGLATILISAFAFKKAYDKAAPKSRENVAADVDKYLQDAEMQVGRWLKSVIEAFNKDFNEFCSVNGFNHGGQIV